MYQKQYTHENEEAERYQQKILKRTVIIFAAIAVGVLFFCVLSFVVFYYFVLEGTKPAADQADAFMEALKAGNYETAYAMCSPELQGQLEGVEGLRNSIESEAALPDHWNYTSRSMDAEMTTLEGRVTLANGETRKLEIWLTERGEQWLIIRFWY